MPSVAHRHVAHGVSARLIFDGANWRVSGLEESSLAPIALPVPVEMQRRGFPTCDEAVDFVRDFLRSRR
jgi:hypothetical protein